MASKCPRVEQQWEATVLRKSTTQLNRDKDRTAAARRAGNTETSSKVSGEQRARSDKNRQLDNADDAAPITIVGIDFGRSLLQARNAKGLKQKDLASRLNIKPAIIQEYEQGKAQPDGSLISRIERILGCKLPRPSKK